ncbi:hypothetical protein BCR32DRAFT_14031 [Anaeromyces robustus]|uniref:Uncharacterized protein n=1 Tax=Anaeromyces robustus TaxID=1754192 RepID=A0A1Y1X5T2_9FUNG|nr:hypothetical protein BCR32DRAFT_14031 [Anaeromyces robustus]|eukprot:ORX81169.1 hypothetical protein BCR32DRAFT_14031 [Anaeromyces robustus]
MKFYSVLAFFLLCTMLVLSNPIRSTEETENKFIEKRAFTDYVMETYKKLIYVIGKASDANAKQKEKERKECIRRKEYDYNNCIAGTSDVRYCSSIQQKNC